MNLKRTLYLGLAGLMIVGIGIAANNVVSPIHSKRIVRKANVNKSRKLNNKKSDPASALRTSISYRKSSETIPYPKGLSARKDRIVVSLKKQRAYLMRGKKLRYEFYVSTGKNVRGRQTPKGHYRIDGVRTPWFYAASEHEGARYATGWHDGGVYLFHETPSNRRGRIIKSVAKDLGKRGSSYGCVHLSTSDAKWFYYHIPTGMRVIIR